ncbi:MAG: efflux RND transporter periplasmic adaptor subunit [Cellvibrio sp.]
MLLRSRSLTLLALGVLSLFLSACGSKESGGAAAGQGPVEVGVVTITTADAPLTAELPGRTTAYRRAEVRPQVTGIIQKRLFEEGAEIKAGTQLYQIDEATYRAAHATAKAELARAEANLLAAEAREKRYKELVSAKAISQQDYDDALANLGQARASVAAGKAAVETATINLKYTKVMAPISGVIGKSSVTEGALVTAGQADVLAIIQQLDPIYVDVSQSVDQLLALRRQMIKGNVAGIEKAKVRLVLENGSVYEHEGVLQFSEVGVNETTGTVTLRALFPNPDRLLLPGMFVRTELQEGLRTNAILVSQRGVTRDRSGKATALVVNKDGTVEQRQIVTSRTLGDQWLVEDGLAVGDQVIVEGLQKVRPGMPVKAVPAQIAVNKTEE